MAAVDHIRFQAPLPERSPRRAVDGDAFPDGGDGAGGDPRGVRGVRQQPGKDRGRQRVTVTAERCECDYEPYHHGQPCPNRPMDHGPDIRTSPELCGPCLFGCEDDFDE